MTEKNVYSICEHIASQCLAVRSRRFTELFGTICLRISRTTPERWSSRLRSDSWNSFPRTTQADEHGALDLCHSGQQRYGQTRRIYPIMPGIQDWFPFSRRLDRRDQADLGPRAGQHAGTGPGGRRSQEPGAPRPVAGNMESTTFFAAESRYAGGDWRTVEVGEVANVCQFAAWLEHPL